MNIKQRTSELLLWDLRRHEIVAHLIAEFKITKEQADEAVTTAQQRVLPNQQ